MAQKIRVGIIFGGKSSEHQVSLASAQAVARAIDREKYDVMLIGITQQGRWLLGEHVFAQLAAASPSPLLAPSEEVAPQDASAVAFDSAMLIPGALAQGSPLAAIDIAFPLVHGTNGEDGTLQGLLELAGVPYVGAGVAASAVGMDKVLMKTLLRAHNLPVMDWQAILRRDWEANPEETIRQIENTFGYPCFIKPANLGSSVGVTQARNWDELAQALATAAQFDRKLIAERAARNVREIECSVLGNDDPIAALPGEVISQREFYDYAAKYDGTAGTRLLAPADLAPDVRLNVQALAVRAFQALDVCGMARVDFFLDRVSQKLWVNELNTLPGFTAVSMYPKMWEASGLAYPALIDRLIQLALERHADKQKSKTVYEI